MCKEMRWKRMCQEEGFINVTIDSPYYYIIYFGNVILNNLIPQNHKIKYEISVKRQYPVFLEMRSTSRKQSI
jgi:hypothetical protein